MAKSIRSKWKRKCRAVKRERYGKKELDRLKKTLGIDEAQTDVKMTEITEIATVTTAQEIKDKQAENKQTEENMDLEDYLKKYNPKTLRDKNGAFPVWLHPRKVKQRKAKKRKQAKSSAKSKKHK